MPYVNVVDKIGKLIGGARGGDKKVCFARVRGSVHHVQHITLINYTYVYIGIENFNIFKKLKRSH
jgi:hypothetical protein